MADRRSMGYPDGWNQLAYCNNGVINQVDYLGCGIIESTIQKATQAKIDEFLNSESIEKAVEGLILPSPKDDSDLEVFAKVSIELSDITVKYRHGFIFDTESEMKLANRPINKNIFKKLTRLRPDIYRIRDPKNDSLGPSGAVDSNTSSNNENVGYSQTEWLYTVTVDEISFTIKMHIDYSTIWRHFKPE